MCELYYDLIVGLLSYSYQENPAECIAALSSVPRAALIGMPQEHRDDLPVPIVRYIEILGGSKENRPFTKIESTPAENIHQYAYLRVLDFETCMKYYMENGFMCSTEILPYLPIVIRELRLPATFLLYHNTFSIMDAWVDLLETSNDPVTRRLIPEDHVQDRYRNNIEQWLSVIKQDSLEMQYLLTWIKHSQDDGAAYLQTFLPHLSQQVRDAYNCIPKRVKFSKVVVN